MGGESIAVEGSWRRMLEARPVRNAAAEARRDECSGLRITVKKERPPFLVPPLSWIVRPRLKGTAALDRLGEQVWDMCTGERTVEGMVEEFSHLHGLTFHEARVAVTSYLRLLVERGALAMAV